jgi:hypothetical protein
MRVFIATALVVVLVFGCSHLRITQDAGLGVWRSHSASLRERAEAGLRLVPIGTKQVKAERVLGRPSRREYLHGDIILRPAYGGPGGRYSAVCRDLYDFTAGDYVCLTFNMAASPVKREERPLVAITTGNTNDNLLPRRSVHANGVPLRTNGVPFR